jgi:hypothetical protein
VDQKDTLTESYKRLVEKFEFESSRQQREALELLEPKLINERKYNADEEDLDDEDIIAYDDGGIVIGERDRSVEDEEIVNGSYPIQLEFTHEVGEELLHYIYERQEIMRVLKIHPMGILNKPMQELVKALEHLFPEAEKVALNADS